MKKCLTMVSVVCLLVSHWAYGGGQVKGNVRSEALACGVNGTKQVETVVHTETETNSGANSKSVSKSGG